MAFRSHHSWSLEAMPPDAEAQPRVSVKFHGKAEPFRKVSGGADTKRTTKSF